MPTFLLNNQSYPVPQTKEEFGQLVSTLAPSHGELQQSALLYLLTVRLPEQNGEKGVNTHQTASMVSEGKYGTLHLVHEACGRPEFAAAGYYESQLSPDDVTALLTAFTPFREQAAEHPNVMLLESAREHGLPVSVLILARDAADSAEKERYLQLRTTTLFNMFNEGLLRGSDAGARQALLDSFGTLPNRLLTAEGQFLMRRDEEPNFIRQVPQYAEQRQGQHSVGGIDKFVSLLTVRWDRLIADGNRVIPSAMIRDGVYVGKRNIFMFHAAVNIAAYIGDDNLIDSHASIASSAQLGSRNKIGSFVSLEGVLSPANAVPVTIGDDNFFGTFARIGTGIAIGNKNFIAAGVNLSLGTKLKDCREGSSTKGEYINVRDLNGAFDQLAIAPNNAIRDFFGVSLVPGEYILFENTEDFMSRFEGDTRIKSSTN
mgnify:CR=1 FL=1